MGQGLLPCLSPAEGFGTGDGAREKEHPVCRIQAQAGEQGGHKSRDHTGPCPSLSLGVVFASSAWWNARVKEIASQQRWVIFELSPTDLRLGDFPQHDVLAHLTEHNVEAHLNSQALVADAPGALHAVSGHAA